MQAAATAQSRPVAASSAVEMRNVTKTYRHRSTAVSVLDGIDLRVGAGEFLAMMGPSGSGKTTLLNLIAGLDKPTSGEVIVAGAAIHSMARTELARWRARNIGFVFQFYNLLPTMSAQRNVELPLLLRKMPAGERAKRVRTVLEIVGLVDRATHKPAELSGGQQQRVAIARAIVSDPTVIVCDEPTGDLDRKNADDMLQLLSLLNRDHGKTIVMVTHDPLAAERATRTVKINKGQLSR
jgi:putative ABC transport system ATP-binding protein